MNVYILTLSVLLSVFSIKSFAQTIQPKPFEYPYDVLVYDLPTSTNGVNYRIYVREPLRDPENGEKASVFYFLDPLALFVPSAVMSANYEYFNYIPPAYFIGIGYSNEEDGIPKQENRTRDYTPTSFTPPDSTHFLSSSPVDYMGSGGLDAFLDVLEDQIIPFVQEHFDVSNSDSVLIGKSLSGLALTHTLLTRPELFNRYLIVSPSLWWDDWNYPRHERYFMKQVSALQADSFKNETRAYFAVGEAEERFGMITDLYLLVNTLNRKRIKKLKMHMDVLEGEIHEGVFPSAFMKGILALYSHEAKRRSTPTPVKWDN